MLRKTSCLFLLSISFFSLVSAQKSRTALMDSVLQSLYQQGKFNGNVLVAEKGKAIFQKSYGLANETTQQPLDANSIFELASCSKQFTAMGIVLLMEQSKLQLDEPLAKYIPELSFYKGITIRQLLLHTSGLPDYMELMDSTFDKSKIATNKDMIALFAKHQPKVLFEPNNEFRYSNTGYALLASIIEKASGQSFAEYLQQNIFKPLHMNRSFVYTRRLQPKKVDNYALGYVYSEKMKAHVLPDSLPETNMVVWLDGIVGDGCVNSTVGDLLLWDQALYTNQLVNEKSKQLVFSAATLSNGKQTSYGLGWALVDNDPLCGRIANHSGGWPGYKTMVEREIDSNKTIIILQNHETVSVPLNSLRTLLYNKPLPVKKVRQPIELSIERLQQYVGVYEIQEGVELSITLKEKQLYTQLTGQSEFPIYVESEDVLFLKVVDAQLHVGRDNKGKVTHVTLHQGGRQIKAERKEQYINK